MRRPAQRKPLPVLAPATPPRSADAPRASRSPWPGSPDGREPAKGALVVSLRRGVASRGFAPVALSEPVPIAEMLQLAQCTVRAEGLFTAWLTGKHGEGPAGKVLMRVVRALQCVQCPS